MWYNDLFNPINLTLGGKKTNKQLAEFKNHIEFQNVFARLVHKALSRYNFENLPDTVNERVLKMSLLFHGSVGFFEKEGNLLALPALPNASVTLYGDFKSMYVYGRNGYNAEIALYVPGGAESKLVNKPISGYAPVNKQPMGVWVRENEMVFPFMNHCINYAEKIADTYRTLDVSRKNIKTPYIIAAEEQVVGSVKKFMEQRDSNMDYVVSSGIFPADKINLLPIQTTAENLTACTDLIEWYMNDFLSLCGLNNNANQDKKERLLVDEVNANNEATETDIDSTVRYLQQQLDFVNECFGTDIRIEKAMKEEEEYDVIFGMDSDTGSGEMGSGSGEY